MLTLVIVAAADVFHLAVELSLWSPHHTGPQWSSF